MPHMIAIISCQENVKEKIASNMIHINGMLSAVYRQADDFLLCTESVCDCDNLKHVCHKSIAEGCNLQTMTIIYLSLRLMTPQLSMFCVKFKLKCV